MTLDVGSVAQDVFTELVAAVPPSEDSPWWETMPEYTQLNLQGYPVANHRMEPQIFVYPVKDLGVNEVAGKAAENLQKLLQSQQVGQEMPYLPLYNDAQIMHAQVKYLDFKNGNGVRYLIEFAQGVVPINNRGLLYTYQGLTADGGYYVAAVLPVNLSVLPADENDGANLPSSFTDNFTAYMEDTVNMLEQQPAGDFTPDLSKLDAMMQSIEIKVEVTQFTRKPKEFWRV